MKLKNKEEERMHSDAHREERHVEPEAGLEWHS